MIKLNTKVAIAASCLNDGDVTVKCNSREKGVLTAGAPSLQFSATAGDGRFEILLIKPAAIPSRERCIVKVTSNNAHATIPVITGGCVWKTLITGGGITEGAYRDDAPPPEVDTTVEVSEDE